MKKTHLLVGLGISISLLTACQNSSSNSNSATTEAETTTQTTVAPKPVTDYTLYNSVLKDYKEVVENVTKHSNDHSKITLNDNVNSIAYLVKKGFDSPGISYTLYDFDKNNVDELVISMDSSKENHYILDIYTISDGKLIRVTNRENKLDMIGERMQIFPLEDGTFLYIGVGTSRDHGYIHYKLNDKGDALEEIKEIITDDNVKTLSPKIDLKQKEWKPTQWYITSPEKQKEVTQKKLDIQAIQNGDYSSLKGTWVDGTGHTFIFDEKGLVDENYEMKLSYFKEYKGTLIGGYGPKNSPVGGAAVYIIPGGVPMTADRNDTFIDPIQTDKDRIFAGQQFPRYDYEFHYRIDD